MLYNFLSWYFIKAVMLFYDTEQQQYHRMAVNYHDEKFYNIGQIQS